MIRNMLACADGPVEEVPHGPPLTPREEQVLAALADGLSYKQIAGELGISIDTVRSHIRSLYRKLDVHCVAEAVRAALTGRFRTAA
jgi:DNA-binding NarL/FixJ family response regulator